MSKTYFSADLHFGHRNIIKYCKRPFENEGHMDKVMIGQWNRTVGPKDTVYCLGDFTMLRDTGFDEVCKIIEQLNGYIKLIWGNHDHRKLWGRLPTKYPDKIELLGPHIEINVDGHDFTLCHYAHQVWNRSHFGSFHLFGHTHGTLEGIGKSLDVGVDEKYKRFNNWAPFSVEEIVAIMETKQIFGEVTD